MRQDPRLASLPDTTTLAAALAHMRAKERTAEPAPKVAAPSPSPAPVPPATRLLDDLGASLEDPARPPSDMTAALERYFSDDHANPPAIRDRVIAASFERQPDGKRATAPVLAENMKAAYADWKAVPGNKRKPAADFVVEHFAATMTAAGVRGLTYQIDASDRAHYGKTLACEHPALDYGRSLLLREGLNTMPPAEAQSVAAREQAQAKTFLLHTFGSDEKARAAFALQPDGKQGLDDVAAHMAQTREAWMRQFGGVGGSGQNAQFIAGYMEKNLAPEAKANYLDTMPPPMRKFHENCVADLKEIPSRSIPDVPMAPPASPAAAPVQIKPPVSSGMDMD